MISIARIKKWLYLRVVWYFRFFANISLRRWKPRVIAVTGSVGKTTLLNLLELQLGERAHYSHNANSAYGICFDILGIDGVRGSKLKWLYLFAAAPFRAFTNHNQEFYVVEIDGERPKETEFLASWLKPEVTLWVSVGRTHAVYFDEQVKQGLFETVEQAITHEFMFLPRHTKELVIYNLDDKLIEQAMKENISADKKPVSLPDNLEYRVWADRTEFETDDKKYHFSQPMPKQVATQLLLLKQLADYLDEPVVEDLSGFVQPPGRSNFFRGKKGTKLIDSSYNAHLISVKSIIGLYQEIQAQQKWIVIGDIVEQGEAEASEHKKLGQVLREAEFDRYVLVGRRTQKYTYPELDESKSVTFLRPIDAVKYLENELRGEETVLFKGSQYLEGVIEHLLEDPADVARLPRQEPAAKKRRAKWGL